MALKTAERVVTMAPPAVSSLTALRDRYRRVGNLNSGVFFKAAMHAFTLMMSVAASNSASHMYEYKPFASPSA